VHIILPRRQLPLARAVIFFSPTDRRPLVAIPTENLLIVGPTETEFDGDPCEVSPERQDIEYLLEALSGFFPNLRLTGQDVVARAGLRPLYDQTGKPAGEISRAYHIEWQRDGLLAVLGGKLTLHRRAAKEALDVLAQRLNLAHASYPRFASEARPLPGAVWTCAPEKIVEQLAEAGVAPLSIAHLLGTYGSRARLFVDLLAEDPAARDLIAPTLPFIRAEAAFSMRYEMAERAQDFTERRTDLSLRAKVERVNPEIEALWPASRESMLAYG
jgi:glycerol-3-phosphate dehydrogenase